MKKLFLAVLFKKTCTVFRSNFFSLFVKPVEKTSNKLKNMSSILKYYKLKTLYLKNKIIV